MLTVKYGNQKFTMDIPVQSTLQTLKKQIETISKVPFLQQKLFFSGKQLKESDKTLIEFGFVQQPSSPQTLLLLKQQVDPSQKIVLFVRTIQRELDFRVGITLSDKIEKIRFLINEKVSLPSNYSLVYSGIVLQDEGTILDYGIKERSSIYIVTQIVMEVENPTGEKVKMRINDNRITGEVVERLVEQRRAYRNQRKRRNPSESENPSSNSISPSTTVTASASNTSDSSSSRAPYAGFGGSFMRAHSGPRKRSRTNPSPMESTTTFDPSSGSGDGVTTCSAVTSSPASMVDPLTSNCNGTTTTTRVLPPRNLDPLIKTQKEEEIAIETSPIPMRKNQCQELTMVKIEGKEESKSDEEEKGKERKRCFKCTKKIGLTGIKCRCSQHFCGQHRYPEEHACSFDYRSKAKEELAKANPKIAASKVIPIGRQ